MKGGRKTGRLGVGEERERERRWEDREQASNKTLDKYVHVSVLHERITDFNTVKSKCKLLRRTFNQFPLDKLLNQTKLKAFADDILVLDVTKMIISVFDRVENIVGKRRNCLYKQFLLFPQCFQKASSPTRQKVS